MLHAVRDLGAGDFLGAHVPAEGVGAGFETNDELSRPYALAGGIESVNQRTPRGFRFVVAPASAETLELGRRAYVHAMCLSERSIAKDRSYANDFEDGKKNLLNLMDDQVQASSNVATGVKSAFAALSYDVTAMPAACSDACLQDSSCVASTWDAILDEVVVTKADEAAAMAYVASRPGEVFAYARLIREVTSRARARSRTRCA